MLSFESLLRQECRKTRRGRITRKDRWHCSGGHIRCERIGIERIPLLASPQGGVAERLIKCRESLRWSRGRGGFPIENNLNRVQPHDWTKFLRARLDGHGPGAPLDGLNRGGYKLVYKETPSEYFKNEEERRRNKYGEHPVEGSHERERPAFPSL